MPYAALKKLNDNEEYSNNVNSNQGKSSTPSVSSSAADNNNKIGDLNAVDISEIARDNGEDADVDEEAERLDKFDEPGQVCQASSRPTWLSRQFSSGSTGSQNNNLGEVLR